MAESARVSSKYLLDTNVLLFVCFFKESYVADLVTKLLNLNKEVFISSRIVDEAAMVTEKNLGKRRDLFYLALAAASKKYSWIHFDDGYLSGTSKHVNNNDLDVFLAAKELQAKVLTADLKLISELRQEGVSSCSPLMELRALAEDNGEHPLGWYFRPFGFSKSTGSIYIQAHPTNWVGQTHIGRFTLFDVKNLGWCYFDTDLIAWVFQLDVGKKLVVYWEPVQDEVTVAMSFRVEREGMVNLSFRIHERGKAPEASNETVALATDKLREGPAYLGHSRDTTHHWSGVIFTQVISPYQITRDTWKKLIELGDE